MRQYTLRKSKPDDRDYNLARIVMQTAPDVEEVTTSQFCGPVYDQGDHGFCWSHMMAAILNNFLRRYFPGLDYKFSPLFIAAAIKASEYSEFPDEEGDSIRAAVKGVQKLGAVAESIYPYFQYDLPLVFSEITDLMRRMAARATVGPYAKLETPDEMIQALYANNALALGIIWTSSADTDHWLDMPNGSIRGGHAIAGFDVSKTLIKKGRQGWIKFQNSHSDSWGEKGFGYISFDYLRAVSDFAFPFLIDCFAVAPNILSYLLPAIKQYYTDNSSVANIDGHPMLLDQPAFIVPATGRFVIPMRAFGQQAGYKVDYHAGSKTAEFTLR